MGYTILLLTAKQSRENQCNEAGRLKKMYQKSSALSIRFECEEVSLQMEFTTLPPKPQPLCETWNEKGIGEKGIAATG
jgi:hypothetical protein